MHPNAKANKRARKANASREAAKLQARDKREAAVWASVPVRALDAPIRSNSLVRQSGQGGNAGDASGIAYLDTNMRADEKPRANTNAKSAVWHNGTPLRYWEPAISAYDGKN